MVDLPPNNPPEYDLEGTNEEEGAVQEAVDQEVEIEDSSSEYESSEEEEYEEAKALVQQPSSQEIDLTEGEIDLSAIITALETVLEESRTLSRASASLPPRENPFPEYVSEESTPAITYRNMIASASGPANPTHVTLTAEQFPALLMNTRPLPKEDRPVQLKPEKPSTFNGERTKLRSFLVLC